MESGNPERKKSPTNDVCTKFKWGELQQQAFDTLKACLTSPPLLKYPDYQKPFTLHTDASMCGLGAVLYQDVDDRQHLKWAITKKFSDYLYGHQFTVFTDNNPLTYVLQKAKLDATGHRWIAELSSYNFNIRYRSGKSNGDADALSRLPHYTTSNFDEIGKETIRALCHVRVAHPLIETLCMSTSFG